MRPDDPHDFEALRRLLALKRHEAPPPGYFHFFPGRVIARIRAGETSADSWVQECLGSAWFRQIATAFETRPLFSSTVGFAMMLLAIGGLWGSEPASVPSIGAAPVYYENASLPADALFRPRSSVFYSTNGLLPQQFRAGSLFDQERAFHLAHPAVQQVKW